MKANPYINPVPTKDGQVLGYVHSLETFGAVDGPGIRFVAFMQGCNMRCKFCHNPDTWKKNVGTQMTASELLEKALPYRAFWGEDGGITLSGGEILLQPEFALEVFKKCKEHGVSTCLDTCGAPFTRREPWFSLFNAADAGEDGAEGGAGGPVAERGERGKILYALCRETHQGRG